MTKLADASINSFGPSPKADVPPEDPIFVMTSSQLQEVISRTIQPLQDRIESLEGMIGSQLEEMATLRTKLASQESLQESEISRICVDIAQDRRRLCALEKVEPQPLQKDRGEILRALIAANGGKMLAKDARAKMHLSKNRFSELLATLKGDIDVKPSHSDKRKLILILS
jgi:hypothetical protein